MAQHRNKKLDRNMSALESDLAARLTNIIRSNDLPRDLINKMNSETKQFFSRLNQMIDNTAA